MEMLFAEFNEFTGTVPTELGLLTSLTNIKICKLHKKVVLLEASTIVIVLGGVFLCLLPPTNFITHNIFVSQL